jgi:hypothetical protein
MKRPSSSVSARTRYYHLKRRNKKCVAAHTKSQHTTLTRPLVLLHRRTRQKSKKWVSATHIYNYMSKDPLVDWLKLRARRGTRTTSQYTRAKGFTEFIMNRGVEFESELIKYINLHIVDVVSVAEKITDESCKEAIRLMKEGVPVLHSVPVRNTENNTQGLIDLLVRSDYLEALVEECPLEKKDIDIHAPLLPISTKENPHHYVVIDIKFSTLPLRADGKHLLNSGHYPAYKAQTLIYTQAIGKIQGYTSRYAFIMGRRWRFTSKDVKYRNLTCLNKLGTIDFDKIDKDYKIQTPKAIKWVRDVAKYGDKWTVYPPSRPELYPNMCVDSGDWNKEKEKIAEKIGEITTVWYCGIKHRINAIVDGVTSWRDENCNSATMGHYGVRGPVIDKILSINRQTEDKIRPKKIESNMYEWKQKKCKEFYVDFETLSDIFANFNDLPKQGSTDMIFMIGVGWEDKNGWNYKNFTCNQPTYKEEYRIMDEFAVFISKYKNPKLYHWCAEERFWTGSENRQFYLADEDMDGERTDNITDNWKLYNWTDMRKLFLEEPIVIKDCFKFGLKSIAKAMFKHKMIKTKLDSECESGMTAMISAWKCYKEESDPSTSKVMKDIGSYNQFDCKVLWDILTYLRKNVA